MGKRSRIALLSCLILGLLGLPAPARALSSVESCFYSAINRERSRVGRPSLRLMSDLTTIARRHSRRMASDHTIYHNNNLGNEVSGHWWAAGENVGMGDNCQQIHDAFMGSPGHRSNIIDRDYNQVGVGVAFDENGTVYVTEDFAGRPSGGPRPIVHPKATAKAPVRRPVRRRIAPVSPPEPRTVVVLLRLLGLDASRVDKTSGEALGV